MQQLELVKEAKIFDIVEGSLDPRLEASGVLAKDGLFYVIFDNLPHVACIGPELSWAARNNHMIIQEKGHRRGFEDIAYDSWPGRFYILIESLPRGRAKFMAAVQEYDANFRYIDSAWLDFPLDRPNKGLEGLTCVRREEQTYLLGLCEGNRCKGGVEGRIHVFQRGRRNWDRVGKIQLPETVLFEDYSGIAVTGDRIAVISQVSSALWLGSLAPSGWQITGPGTSYALPRASDGSIAYGTVEGVSWIAPDQLVMVSDKAKPGQDQRCRAKDQSIHIFRIPALGRPLAARPTTASGYGRTMATGDTASDPFSRPAQHGRSRPRGCAASGTTGDQQMPATLKVTHKAIGAEVRRGAYDVVVDGERAGSVEMNHTIEIPVEPGRHTLQVRNGRNSSSTQTFDAAEEEIVAFRCTGKRLLPIFLASFVVPRLALKLVRE